MKLYEVAVFTTTAEEPARYLVEAENANDAEERATFMFGADKNVFAIGVKPAPMFVKGII